MTGDIKTDPETLRKQLLLLQEKSYVAYEIARGEFTFPGKVTLWQVIAAHQSKLARRHAGVIE